MDQEQVHALTGVMPHCDQRVLHALGMCRFCDERADLQALRITWGIAFTGNAPTEGQLPCPSDAARGTGGAHVWGGNRPDGAGYGIG